MATNLYPDSLISSSATTYTVTPNTTSIPADLDAVTASFIDMGGKAFFTVGMADHPTMTDAQLASVTVEFDARPTPFFEVSQHVLNAEMYDTATGQVYARSFYISTAKDAPFSVSIVAYGSVISRAALNRSAIRMYTANGLASEHVNINNLHIIVTDLFDGPTAVAIGPTGALSDNTPTVQFTITAAVPAVEIITYARLRVFNAAQYGAGGFNPETSPALWDSGLRSASGLAITTVVLPPDNYRAYVAGIQQVIPGEPWTGTEATFGTFGTFDVGAPSSPTAPIVVFQQGPLASFAAFSIVTAAPLAVGPTIRADAVRDLTDAQRLRITEPFQALPRATLYTSDGVFVRDLDVVSGNVTLDAAALIRGQTSFICTDVDLVPASSGDASGERLPLHPFGSYVHVCYGVQLDRFNQVFVGVGVFRITNVRPDREANTVEVKGKDFSLNLQESKWGQDTTRQDWSTVPPTPFTILATARLIITEAGLAYRTPTASGSSVIVNYVNKRGDDRTKALQGLANSINGWTHYADIDGVVYFGAGPDITADAIIYTFNDANPTLGRLAAQVIGRDEELARDIVYDTVIVTNQAATVIGGAYDSAPGSIVARSSATPGALYVGAGPFSPGGKPYFFASPIITDQAGAQAAARTLFSDVALPADQVTVKCSPVPDLRPDKMVAMPRTPNGPIEKWQVTKVTLPLGIGPEMTWEGVTLALPTVPAS